MTTDSTRIFDVRRGKLVRRDGSDAVHTQESSVLNSHASQRADEKESRL
jgi:hypothetical protein